MHLNDFYKQNSIFILKNNKNLNFKENFLIKKWEIFFVA